MAIRGFIVEGYGFAPVVGRGVGGREWEGEGNGIKKGGGVFILAPTFLFSATLVCLKLSTIPSQIAAKIDALCRERRHFRVQVEAFGSKWPARGSDGLTGIPFHAFQHLNAEQKNTTLLH